MAVKKKKIANVPNLRFPGFHEEWNTYKLDKIAEFSKGKGVSKSDIDKNGVTECIRYGELYTHYREVITEIKSKTNIDKNNLVLSKANDVIIPSSGETQIDIATASCVLKEGIALGGDLNIIRSPNNGIFLSYYLNSKKKTEIANLAQGISVVHLYSSQLATLMINLPVMIEQDKIASFLSLLDERIQTQNKIIKQLESLIKSLRESTFFQKIRFRDEKGNEYPQWKEKRLKEICEIIMGQSPDSTSYNSEGNGLPLIQGNADIKERKTQPRNYTVEITKECKVGDLILTVRAPVGSVARSTHNACIGRGVCALVVNKENNSEYIYQFLINYEPRWISLEQGSTFTAVGGNEIKNIKIYLPSLEEQNVIGTFFSSIDLKIFAEKEILKRYQSQKQYLLKNLFI